MKSQTHSIDALPLSFSVGASAGGVDAMRYLASVLPEDFPSPLFFVLHRKRGANSKRDGAADETRYLLRDILSGVSKLDVIVPEEGDVVRSGNIYLPPQDRHLIISDNRFHLSEEPANSTWRPGINELFKSAAREYKEFSIAVLLTGGLDDGVDGLIETTRQGGITVAQSPDDAYNPILPLNALLKDHPRYVSPLVDMPALFCELCNFPYFANQADVAKRAEEAARRKRDILHHE